MTEKEIYVDLNEIKRLVRCGIKNELVNRYSELFKNLTPIQNAVMTECFVIGLSYRQCGRKLWYCERQIYRIVKQSIESLLMK